MSAESPELKLSKELKGIAKALNETIEQVSGEPLGFALVVFGSDAQSPCSFVSNCDRDSVMPDRTGP